MAPGNYTASSVRPKTGQTIRCDGSTFTGTGIAFRGGGNDVTIDGCTVEGYDPRDVGYGLDAGAIHGDGTSGWTIRNADVHDNAGVGVRLSSDWLVEDSHMYRNGNLGAGGYMADRFTLRNCEIDGNGFAGRSGEHGGTKFVDSRGGLVQGNYVHDNEGRGIWFDTEIFDATIDGNEVARQSYEGIWVENVCGPATITNNYSHDNGTGALSGWIDRANIQVVNGQDIEIAYNRTSGGQHQISMLAAGGYPTYSCAPGFRGIDIHDNTVTLDAGAVGAMSYNWPENIYTNGSMNWHGNHYTVSGGWFTWNGQINMTLTQWKVYHPSDGT